MLLVRRAKPPFENLFSLPGGRVETGETLEDAARRELWEEVRMTSGPLLFNCHVETIERAPDGRVRHHYVIANYSGAWESGLGQGNAEVAEMLWASADDIGQLPLTPGLAAIIEDARSYYKD